MSGTWRIAAVVLAWIGAWAAPTAARADINVEARRPKATEPGVDVELQTKFAFRQGNVNLLDVGGTGRFALFRGRHLLFYFTTRP